MSQLPAVIRAFAVLAVSGVLLIGCESNITAENFDRIQTGMTRAEIVAILGEPDETAGFGFGELSGEAATWSEGDNFITVQFVNNKVFAKQAAIGAKRNERSS
jgi:hypothetical protein